MHLLKRKSKNEGKQAAAPTDSNRPVVPTDSNRPVVPNESNRPVVPNESNRPVVPKDRNRPIRTESNRPRDIKDKLMVCAIDFGTTYSGYAYSMRSDPMKIYCPHWTSGTSTLASYKTPTTVLLDRDEEFVAFGYDAEKMYSELVEEEDETVEDYFYFRRFKMLLYENTTNEKLSTETQVSDIKGKSLPAVCVFSQAIKYLMDHLDDALKTKGIEIQEGDIEWVLTVPAIWNDPAKQFMRQAAEMAGIESHCLVIALEPEAASIFCKELPVEKFEGGSSNIDVFSPGKRYLVLDAGGGTIDMTVHEVKSAGKLQELSRASGGDWGGVTVDKTFKKMLTDIVGEKFLDEYCKENTAEYIELFKDFEVKKRQKIDESSQSGKVTLKISLTFSEKYQRDKRKTISERTKQTKYADSLKWEGDKVRMKKELFKSFFKPSCDEIVNHVKKLLAIPEVKGTNIILMVGGFSESEVVQDAVRSAFRDCRIVIPQEAGLAVLKGAVQFGHDPSIIAARVAKFTYGIGSTVPFDPEVHDPGKKIKDPEDGNFICDSIFSKHVEAGAVVYLNEEQKEHIYHPMHSDQKVISFPVYISENANPMYTDEPGCKHLGQLDMDISDTTGGVKRQFAAKLKFGGTEITVSARNVDTNQTANIALNFLNKEH
ncbi:heat shock 70 kDa protein 12A-like [Crassostrea virginica]